MNIINGKTYPDGNISIKNNMVYINGELINDNDEIFAEKKIVINCTTCEYIRTDRGVEINGNVNGSINAEGSVSCDNITGNVDCGGSCKCDNVSGNVTAGGSVHCDDIGGSVKCGGSLKCGSYDS